MNTLNKKCYIPIGIKENLYCAFIQGIYLPTI